MIAIFPQNSKQSIQSFWTYWHHFVLAIRENASLSHFSDPELPAWDEHRPGNEFWKTVFAFEFQF